MKKFYKVIAVLLVATVIFLSLYIGTSFVKTIKNAKNPKVQEAYYPAINNSNINHPKKENSLLYGIRHLSETEKKNYTIESIDFEKMIVICIDNETGERRSENKDMLMSVFSLAKPMLVTKSRCKAMFNYLSVKQNNAELSSAESIKRAQSDDWYFISGLTSVESGLRFDEIYNYSQASENNKFEILLWLLYNVEFGVEDYKISPNSLTYKAQTTATKAYHNKYFNHIVINADKSVIIGTDGINRYFTQKEYLEELEISINDLYKKAKLENNSQRSKELLQKYEANHPDTYKFKAEDAERLSYDSLFYAALLFSSVSDVTLHDLYGYMQTDDGKMEMCAVFIYGHKFKTINNADKTTSYNIPKMENGYITINGTKISKATLDNVETKIKELYTSEDEEQFKFFEELIKQTFATEGFSEQFGIVNYNKLKTNDWYFYSCMTIVASLYLPESIEKYTIEDYYKMSETQDGRYYILGVLYSSFDAYYEQNRKEV